MMIFFSNYLGYEDHHDDDEEDHHYDYEDYY